MKITIVAGSNRNQSSGTKLCVYLKRVLEMKGHRVRLFDLYRRPVPLFCPDGGQDNENLLELKSIINEADAVILSTPEYHGGLSGVLKNTLDHLGGEHVSGKVVLSVSASGGRVGTGSLLQLQAIVRNLHGINCPEWISIGGESRRFDENGDPADPLMKERVAKATDCFLEMAGKLRRPEYMKP